MQREHTKYTHIQWNTPLGWSRFAISKALMHKLLHLMHTHNQIGIQTKCTQWMRYLVDCRWYSKLEHFPVNNANIGSPNWSKWEGCGCRESGRRNVYVFIRCWYCKTSIHVTGFQFMLIDSSASVFSRFLSSFTHKINIAIQITDKLGLFFVHFVVVEFISMSSHTCLVYQFSCGITQTICDRCRYIYFQQQ